MSWAEPLSVADPASPRKAIAAVAAALARERKVLVTTHVKPDGDALGCVAAMHLALAGAGADSAIYLAGDAPLAPEFDFLAGLEDARRGSPPAYADERTLVALDCGDAERIGDDALVKAAPRIINIDHHKGNPHFGEINLVISSASSTAEIVFFVLGEMEVELTPEIAEALYLGILVDSGRFQYACTSPLTLRVAATLMERGADHTKIFRRVYESVPPAKARLRCRMLDNLRLECDGRLAIGILGQEDFRQAGAGPELTDGLINSLRELKGGEVAALVYANSDDGGDEYRVSLRSAGGVDVRRIARAEGGGGHTQAAGFSTSGQPDEIVARLVESIGKELARRKRRR